MTKLPFYTFMTRSKLFKAFYLAFDILNKGLPICWKHSSDLLIRPSDPHSNSKIFRSLLRGYGRVPPPPPCEHICLNPRFRSCINAILQNHLFCSNFMLSQSLIHLFSMTMDGKVKILTVSKNQFFLFKKFKICTKNKIKYRQNNLLIKNNRYQCFLLNLKLRFY